MTHHVGSVVERASVAVYRTLLVLLPRPFRAAYRNQMAEDFRDLLRDETTRRRLAGWPRAWLRGGTDLVATAFTERIRGGGTGRSERSGPPGSAGPEPPSSMRGRGRTTVFQNLLADARYAWRHLMHHPAFAFVVVLTLAVGIGANTSMFSVVNSVLLNALPYPESDRLATLHHTYEKFDLIASVSAPGFVDYREKNEVFEELAAIDFGRYDVSGDEGPERILGAAVTPGYFQVLRIDAEIGRTFLEEEAEPGNDRVVVLSHELWQRRFGADPGVVGTSMRMGGEAYTVVGVVPEDLESQAELLVPLSFTPEELDPNRWTNEYLQVIGRLTDGVSFDAAQANADVLAGNVREMAREQTTFLDDSGWNVGVFSARDEMVGDVETALLVLLGAVGLVFLIACANVSNLFLARSLGREREIAVRMSMGASRGRISSQLVTEGVMLSLAGGALGLALGGSLNRVLVRLGPADIPRLDAVALDGRVLAFTAALSVLAGVLFATLPALQASAADLQATLKEGGGRGASSRRGHRLKDGLVVAEIALALLLLVGSGLMLRSFGRIVDVAPGFDPANTVSFRVAPLEIRYPETEDVRVFYAELLDRIAGLPGVSSVGAVNRLPLAAGNNTASFTIEGRETGEDYLANMRYVAGDYFQTARIPLLRGRDFDATDNVDGEPVAVIDEEAARRFWPGEDPIGQRVDRAGSRRIIGVVGSVKHGGLDRETQAHMYLPVGQLTPRDMAVLVRTANDFAALAATLRTTVSRINPDQPLYQIQPMEDVISASLAQPRFNALLLVTFAGFALLLAAVGIQGVLSQLVGRRSREIGIRMALGADKRSVLRLVVGRGLALTGVGLVLGLLASLAGTRALASLLFGVSPTDPVVLVGVSAFLLAVAAVAAYLPARRATRVDPVRAMSVE
jgi:predicted permease